MRGRPFKKGQSGNPGGRPKDTACLKELAKSHADEAIETVITVMRRGNYRERLQAAVAVLDRAYGRPGQQIQFDGETEVRLTSFVDGPPQETREEWEARKMRERMAKDVAQIGGNSNFSKV